MTVLVVGATGSIGRLVVEEAIQLGHGVRALVRNNRKARQLPAGAHVVVGDVTQPETLTSAVRDVDAVVFTLGSEGGGKAGAESVDYGGVRNVLAALGHRTVRIALMTSVGVTNRTSGYNRPLRRMTGSVAPSGSCAPAACRTPSCGPAGSTTTARTNIGSCSCRATRASQAAPATAP